ncbi:hypothetical protein GLOIN_2v1839121 [Rhizophagus clarus]|uniref:Uncharacterized protein n=1 Tax=Rhizophagus clarus TaxID=94130 RepID=A0A8H3LFJ4_9GLOM|nr:hypothetical protein GLOIN_2v1839121 [Rhizophagus clarus]
MNSPGTRPNVNHTNSLSPLTQNTTFKQFVDVESLEWHQFLTNQMILAQKQNMNVKTISPISSKKTALHCVAPEPTTASNIEWNKFMRAPDDNTTIFDSDSSESYKAIHSSLLSSARYFNYVTNGFKKNRLYLNTSNYKDSSESSAIKFSDITTNEFSKVNQDGQKNSKEPLRIGSKMTMDQEILKRIQDLELKNARLQFEINFLKKDIKWLTATIKKIKLYNKPTVRDN